MTYSTLNSRSGGLAPAVFAVALVALSSGGAFAQAKPHGAEQDSRACADISRFGGTVGQGQAKGEDLGDHLARTDGVICPPSGIDPQIRAEPPAADANRMPVIPPPGGSGGDPAVRPK